MLKKSEREWLARKTLDLLAQMPPREMRRALMTGFGNASLEQRERVEVADLPSTAGGKSRIGFLQ